MPIPPVRSETDEDPLHSPSLPCHLDFHVVYDALHRCAWFTDANNDLVEHPELLEQTLCDRLGKRLDQVVLPAKDKLLDRIVDSFVVHRLLQVVGTAAAGKVAVQVNIDFELATKRLLVGEHAVISVEHGVMQPDDVSGLILFSRQRGNVLVRVDRRQLGNGENIDNQSAKNN
jgi:hypothetical protein